MRMASTTCPSCSRVGPTTSDSPGRADSSARRAGSAAAPNSSACFTSALTSEGAKPRMRPFSTCAIAPKAGWSARNRRAFSCHSCDSLEGTTTRWSTQRRSPFRSWSSTRPSITSASAPAIICASRSRSATDWRSSTCQSRSEAPTPSAAMTSVDMNAPPRAASASGARSGNAGSRSGVDGFVASPPDTAQDPLLPL